MKYLCFGYLDEKLWGTKSESEQKAMIDACFSYDEELRRNGAWAGGEGIQGPDNATTLRYQNGKVAVTDGPYAETKELLGGLLILETPNPENFMVGSYSFYADPTHRNPIPSATLQFLLESRGLGRIEVMKLRPWDAAKIDGNTEIIKRFNEYFYSAPDYGIIGWKV